MLNGSPPKHDDMQAVAFVPEMSHFVVLRGRIFMDQLCNVIKVVRWASEGVIIKPQVVLPFDSRVGKQMLRHRDEVIGDNFHALLGT
jgi:hypothetical protein